VSARIDAGLMVTRPPIAELAPFLPAGWREHLQIGGGLAGAGYQFPSAPYRPPARVLPRAEPDALLARIGEDALAVVDPGAAPALSGIPNAVMAAELARAFNDWLADRLAGAPRLHRALVVAPRDGELAAAEIRRAGADPQVAMVVLAHPPVLLGERSLHPLLTAAAELGLPVCLQAGGAFAGSNAGPGPVGHPSSYDEYAVSSAYGAIPHLISALSERLFERIAGLRLVVSGFGAAWLPSVLWRMGDAAGETVADRVRLTTWGLEQPADPAQLLAVLDAVGAQRLLMAASGDAPEATQRLLAALPEPLRRAVGHDTAAAWLRLGAPAPSA
jgi:predicted TIM-barrel fold metal-dependent hydrolase